MSDPTTEANPYRERAHLVAHLARLHPAVLAYNDPNEPDWPVLYVTTEAGQMSWHIAPDDLDLFEHVPVVDADHQAAAWDGHSTEEKYRRLTELGARAVLTQALARDVRRG